MEARDTKCPYCATSDYYSHEASPFRYHITSRSFATENVYHLVKLNVPSDPDAALNECDCEWGQRRAYAIRHRGEVLHACWHIRTAADLYSRGLHRYPPIGYPHIESVTPYELFSEVA